MYKERILNHYKNPRNFGEADSTYDSAEVVNPSCGDTITGYVLTKDGEIQDLRFKGEGCAISMASASILSQEIQGIDARRLDDYDRDKIQDALGIEISPMRLKCALLPRDAFVKCIDK
jgi:nitrogen fixation NifU-like protein